MLGGFLFCLGLFAAGIHLYKRFFLRANGTVQRRLRVIERLPITQKNSLLLVELDGREVLLATGPDAPTVLVPHPKRDVSFEDSLLDLETSEEQIHA
jgi:flagellar biogenesis protein FliO